METQTQTERLVYMPEMAKRYGVHVKHIPRLIKDGRIPKPLESKFGKGPCWRESTVSEHLRNLQ